MIAVAMLALGACSDGPADPTSDGGTITGTSGGSTSGGSTSTTDAPSVTGTSGGSTSGGSTSTTDAPTVTSEATLDSSGGTDDTSSTGDGVAGPECPDLRGVFTCPAFQGQPEYTLTVTQMFDGQDITTYDFHYSFDDSTTSYPASADGVTAEGRTSKCTQYKGTRSLAIYPENQPAQTTYNFINLSDDYQADYMGSQAIACVRSE